MTFGIRGNIIRRELPSIVLKLTEKLKRKNIEYLVEDTAAKFIKQVTGKTIKASLVVSPKSLVRISDFIISIGGDGTFLATAKLVNSRGTPIIGVNMGKLGYLAETSTKNIFSFISNVLVNRFRIEERTVLTATSSCTKRRINGMNEIVLSQNGTVKTVFIEVFYNGSLVISYHADGLIVSTPTGSTGYSLSAGGPIVSPGTKVVIIAPICPHTFTARPIILPDDGTIKVNIENRTPISVTADGNSSFIIKKESTVIIKKASYKVKIVKSPESNYFKILNQKLLWGEDKRNSK